MMTKIMQARCGMGAAIGPVELVAKLLEDTMDLAIAEGLPRALSAGSREERRLRRR
ncbi:hypothetical protein [Thiorhodococcus minor]|uniref:Uncharacterized protein n=1 Tax=Thiorhodococcus minor TaxID=57489 RepID=A0A6M0K7U2_9GAMM|nr:hypothetical protein [Thiorhodococcus minor]NEV64455.1 hypothetical protein [Thiorhodococcus minor]